MLIDQTLLPERFEMVECATVESLIHAIKSMQIRGAPAIGVAGAMGIALSLVEAIKEGKDANGIASKIHSDAISITNARPTAVNLSWGISAAVEFLKGLPSGLDAEEKRELLIDFVKKLADDDVAVNRKIGEIGRKLLRSNTSILTHCN